MTASTRMVLLCLIGLLLVILGVLIAFALLIRKRPAQTAAPLTSARTGQQASDGGGQSSSALASAGASGGLVAVTRTETMACPTCRRLYEPIVDFCPHDARKLVKSSQLAEHAGGGVCPACRRGLDKGVRFCPHDGSEVLPIPVYEATRGDSDAKPTGVMAKICPKCRARHDLAATFCGRDGSELVGLN